jgi:ABC-type lipoprotein release transport system permease subunit
MAIRVAHGATTGRVIRLVLTDGLAWPAAGLLLGVPASLAASAALGAFLYEISPGDPVLAVAGAGAFLLVAAAACLGPALRAARVNPIDTLRAD